MSKISQRRKIFLSPLAGAMVEMLGAGHAIFASPLRRAGWGPILEDCCGWRLWSCGPNKAARWGGRVLEIFMNQTDIQFCDGKYLDGSAISHTDTPDIPYGPHTGLCLEPQNFPNTPNPLKFHDRRLEPAGHARTVSSTSSEQAKRITRHSCAQMWPKRRCMGCVLC